MPKRLEGKVAVITGGTEGITTLRLPLAGLKAPVVMCISALDVSGRNEPQF
jgi:hypothetical protein